MILDTESVVCTVQLLNSTISCVFVFVFYVNYSIFLSLDTQKTKALTRKDPAEDFLEMFGRSQPSSDDKSPRKTAVELKREIKDMKEENATLKEMVV